MTSARTKIPATGEYADLTAEAAAVLLGVSIPANPQALHSAYRGAVKRCHPDAGGSDEQFKAATAAYHLLLDRSWASAADATREDHPGLVVWARSRFSTALLILIGIARAFLVLAIPYLVGGLTTLAGLFWIPALAVIGWHLWLSTGRVWWKSRKEKSGKVEVGVADGDTGPVDVMTDERIDRFEKEGR